MSRTISDWLPVIVAIALGVIILATGIKVPW